MFDESWVGRRSETITRSWSSTDALLYALSVGAGQGHPLEELEFTTENTEAQPQKVLPTFANVALSGGRIPLPEGVDLSKMLHVEQGFTLDDALPVEGEVSTSSAITGVYDKGSGALVEVESEARDDTGRLLSLVRSAMFFRGSGGWGGSRGPASEWEKPTGKPDQQVTYCTRTDQALLYRLTGDRNPLHTDPSFASRGGFPQPILHGMCTYGFTGRALLHAAANSEPKRFRAMQGRFTKPVLPGESLTVSMWIDGTAVRFQTTDAAGAPVIDQGTATIV